jgi:uncharacterized membrane protein YebE (DUF533 family)
MSTADVAAADLNRASCPTQGVQMNKSLMAAAVAAMCCVMAGSVMAQNAPDSPASGAKFKKAEARQAKQQARIASGAAAGTLTPHETDKLASGQAKIDAAQQSAKADGTVTHKERKHIQKMEEKQSNVISKRNQDVDKVKP